MCLAPAHLVSRGLGRHRLDRAGSLFSLRPLRSSAERAEDPWTGRSRPAKAQRTTGSPGPALCRAREASSQLQSGVPEARARRCVPCRTRRPPCAAEGCQGRAVDVGAAGVISRRRASNCARTPRRI
eukprot:350699-Chlamydomonas_euryale.AAC.14